MLEEHEEKEEQGEPCEVEEEAASYKRPREFRGSAPLTAYSEELRFPDPRDASPINVQAALRRIIEKERPLTKRYLIKLYVASSPALHRAGKIVRDLVNKALYKMQRAGETVVEDELGDRSLESQVLRLADAPRVRERPAGGRDILEIPPSELFLVLDRLIGRSNDSQPSDEAHFRALLKHCGFSRLTKVRKRHLAKILEAFRRRRMSLESGLGAHEDEAV